MSEIIKIKKGLDIKLKGKSGYVIKKAEASKLFAVKPTDFPGLIPKLDVKIGDSVKAGSPLFHDKYKADIFYTSPVSGKIQSINRGERRRILEVVVESDGANEYVEFSKGNHSSLSKDEIIKNMLVSGVWPLIRQRPYGIVANPADNPKAIYISGFDSAPLAPDYDFILQNQIDAFQKGINILTKLTEGKVHLGLNALNTASPLLKVTNVEISKFQGPHPAGNVGIQIHHIDPINKGDIVWYINPQDVTILGRLFETGRFDASRIVALAGSEILNPQYYQTIIGASIEPMIKDNITNDTIRFISGNVLTGTKITAEGYIGYYDSLISAIPEGNHFEMLGWALPGFNKFSMSRTFFSWLSKNKEYRLDTNLNGGERAFVMSGEYEKVLPMDVLPVQLLKSILINDIDKMEQLGIYEVVEEDLALCEFVCTSKVEVQSILRNGINNLIKELG